MQRPHLPETLAELPQGRQRSSKPKTRTGCITCKGDDLQDKKQLEVRLFKTDQKRIRRVKCGEEKPECSRCLKFGVKCDGYLIPKNSRSVLKRPTLKIRPYVRPGLSKTLSNPSQAPLYRLPSDRVFRNESEQHYFRSFRSEIVDEISGIWDTSFWESVILPSCDEPFILDAVLAISAINLSIKESRQKATMLGGSGISTASPNHYQFALERYGRAIRAMRRTLTDDEQHLRKALIGCLLVFCFEGFQGYPKRALIHVKIGYHLLVDHLISRSSLVVRPNSHTNGSSLVEDELLDTFNRLHTQAVCVIGDSCTPEVHIREQTSGDLVLDTMPIEFADFGEAHRYMTFILKRSAVFIAIAVGLPLAASSRNEMHSDDPTMDWSASVHQPFKYGQVPEHILTGYNKHVLELRRWQQAFNPLRSKSDRPLQVAVTILQAGLIGMRMALESTVVRSECHWDQFLPKFRAIISLCKTVFRIVPKQPSTQEQSGFTLGVTVLPPLYFVCLFCRDPQIRRDAIALMRVCPRREGVWDSGLTTELATFLMEVEEEGMVDGFIPEYARARITKVVVDVVKKTAEVECMKRLPDTDGEVLILKRRIEWD